MADFKTHLTVACAASGLAAASLLAADLAGHEEVLLYFTLGSAGGALPDIDSDTSKPLRIAFDLMALVFAFLAAFSQRGGESVVELLIVWGLVYVLVRYVVFLLFTRLTVHRGIFHSIPAGVFFWFITSIFLDRFAGLSALVSWTGGFFVFFGYLVHLTLDEIYSVDLFKMDLKASFGSALNLGSLKYFTTTVLVYAATIGLFFLMPDPGPFFDTVLDPETYGRIRFFPAGRWFG